MLQDATKLSTETKDVSIAAAALAADLQTEIVNVAPKIAEANQKIAQAQEKLEETNTILSQSNIKLTASINNFNAMEKQITYINSLSVDMTTIKADTQKLATQMVADKADADKTFNNIKDFHKQIFSTKEISLGKKLEFTCANGVWRDQNQRNFLKLQPTCKKPPSYIPSYDTPTTTFASVPTTTFASVPL